MSLPSFLSLVRSPSLPPPPLSVCLSVCLSVSLPLSLCRFLSCIFCLPLSPSPSLICLAVCLSVVSVYLIPLLYFSLYDVYFLAFSVSLSLPPSLPPPPPPLSLSLILLFSLSLVLDCCCCFLPELGDALMLSTARPQGLIPVRFRVGESHNLVRWSIVELAEIRWIMTATAASVV